MEQFVAAGAMFDMPHVMKPSGMSPAQGKLLTPCQALIADRAFATVDPALGPVNNAAMLARTVLLVGKCWATGMLSSAQCAQKCLHIEE
jgi:hypothetical protein